jgi:hypothetical protein
LRGTGTDEPLTVFGIDSYGAWQHECHASFLLRTLARVFGGNLPKERASLIAEEAAEIASPAVLLVFPKPHRPRRRATTGSRQLVLNDKESMKLNVECYSGRTADERPIRFLLGGRQYLVETVLDQWYDPESVFYKVRADDGNLYILRQQTSLPDRAWELVSFRQSGKER